MVEDKSDNESYSTSKNEFTMTIKTKKKLMKLNAVELEHGCEERELKATKILCSVDQPVTHLQRDAAVQLKTELQRTVDNQE